jgi:hypothetical protein
MLRIPYAFLRHAGLPFAYGFVSEGTIRGEFHNGGSGFRRYLFFGARSRSAFSLDSIGRERAQRRPGEARLTQNVLAADRVDRLAGMWAMLGTAVAQKNVVPKAQDNVALGENEARQLMLLIDTGKTGKISKHEWMSFMEAEFDRLDVKKDGELDVKELTQSQLRVSHFGSVGK